MKAKATTRSEYLIWNLHVDAVGYGEYYDAEAADGSSYLVESEYGGMVDGHHAYSVTYIPPGRGTTSSLVLAEGVATVAEGKAIALRHYQGNA